MIVLDDSGLENANEEHAGRGRRGRTAILSRALESNTAIQGRLEARGNLVKDK